MKSSAEDDVLDRLDRMLWDIRGHLAESRNGSDMEPVCRITFEHSERFWGVNTESGSKARRWLYDNRHEVIDQLHLWYRSEYASGLFWTLNDAIGESWYGDILINRRQRDYRSHREALTSVKGRVDEALKPMFTKLAEESESGYHRALQEGRDFEFRMKDAEEQGLIPDTETVELEGAVVTPEPGRRREVLRCECGRLWPRKVKRGKKPTVNPDCPNRESAA